MPTIEYIRNITAATLWDAVTVPEFSVQVNNLPVTNPDECIVRSITFAAVDPANDELYLVWSNLTNDFIGSICGGSFGSSNPHSQFRLNNPVPNNLIFKLYYPSLNGARPVPAPTANGAFSMHLDLIRYTRTPLHA